MLILILISIIINTLIFLNNENIANLFRLYDRPDNFRKIHKSNVPLTGGIFLLSNIFLIIIFLLVDNSYFEKLEIFKDTQDLIIFLFSLILFFLIGFFDDKYDLSANNKFIVMIIFLIPIIFYSANLSIVQIRVSFLEVKYILPNYISIFWTVLCFLLFINALNMFDGINYQVGFFSIYICIFFIINNYFTIFFIIILISLSSFLILNRQNKAFLGDNGSYLLAFLFSYFFVKMYNQNFNIASDHIFLIMIIPGIDLIRLFLTRVSKGYSPFQPDRNHLHHILLQRHSLITVNLIIQFLIIVPSISGYYFGYTYIFLFLQLLLYLFLVISYRKK